MSTPTPSAVREWRAVIVTEDGDERVMGIVAEDARIVETDCGVYPPTPADAHLIAAAPEMYDALEVTLDYWTTTGFAKCEPGCDCIVEAVRAALAKAKGRQA